MMTGSDGVSFLLPQLFLSQQRLKSKSVMKFNETIKIIIIILKRDRSKFKRPFRPKRGVFHLNDHTYIRVARNFVQLQVPIWKGFLLFQALCYTSTGTKKGLTTVSPLLTTEKKSHQESPRIEYCTKVWPQPEYISITFIWILWNRRYRCTNHKGHMSREGQWLCSNLTMDDRTILNAPPIFLSPVFISTHLGLGWDKYWRNC